MTLKKRNNIKRSIFRTVYEKALGYSITLDENIYPLYRPLINRHGEILSNNEKIYKLRIYDKDDKFFGAIHFFENYEPYWVHLEFKDPYSHISIYRKKTYRINKILGNGSNASLYY